MEIERVVIDNFIRNAGHAAKHEGLVRVCPHKLMELCRVYAAVQDAPEVWAGVGPNGWGAGSDFEDADHVKTVLSGWGTDEERARITASRVRLVAA